MEHLKFYSLQDHPFSNAIDGRFYYNSTQHADALLRLKYAIDTRKGLAVLVGDIGTGKTTIARRLLGELDEHQYEAGLLVVLHASVTPDWLMKKIALQLGIRSIEMTRLEILARLHKRLVELHESGMKAVVIMDEVQMLQSREIMEEFRGLLNMEVSDGKLLTFVLCGLPDLEGVLALDNPLKQRIAMKYRLTGFDENITKDYIHHRLIVAGASGELFTPDALTSIHSYSQGIPRLINTICDNAIFEGFLSRHRPVDQGVIDSVALNLGL